MALKATIFKADIDISNMDQHYYQSRSLTIAQHPSENDERMMVRLLGLLFFAHHEPEFTAGLCVQDEPDIWKKELHGDIALWIDVGRPSIERIKKANARSQEVAILCYGENAVQHWLADIDSQLTRFSHCSIWQINDKECEGLASLVDRTVSRNMHLQFTQEDNTIWLTSGEATTEISPQKLYPTDD